MEGQIFWRGIDPGVMKGVVYCFSTGGGRERRDSHGLPISNHNQILEMLRLHERGDWEKPVKLETENERERGKINILSYFFSLQVQPVALCNQWISCNSFMLFDISKCASVNSRLYIPVSHFACWPVQVYCSEIIWKHYVTRLDEKVLMYVCDREMYGWGIHKCVGTTYHTRYDIGTFKIPRERKGKSRRGMFPVHSSQFHSSQQLRPLGGKGPWLL